MFFLFATLLLFSSFLDATHVNRVIVYDNYTLLPTDDIITCITDAGNTTNLTLTLYPASTGDYIFCVSDQTGFSGVNPIDINTVNGDVIVPDGVMTTFQIARSYYTVCFYSNGVDAFIQRKV